jgi:hypothetical protein
MSRGRAGSKQCRDARYSAAVRRQIRFNRSLASQRHPYAPVEAFLRPGDTAAMFPVPVTVYFLHDTLTPGNVRAVWHDHPIVPKVGELVDFDTAGFMGATVSWQVVRQEWLNADAVTLHMTGPTGEVQA